MCGLAAPVRRFGGGTLSIQVLSICPGNTVSIKGGLSRCLFKLRFQQVSIHEIPQNFYSCSPTRSRPPEQRAARATAHGPPRVLAVALRWQLCIARSAHCQCVVAAALPPATGLSPPAGTAVCDSECGAPAACRWQYSTVRNHCWFRAAPLPLTLPLALGASYRH